MSWDFPKSCRFQTAECRKCKKQGHIERACRSQSNEHGEAKTVHLISQEEDFQESEEMLELAMNAVHLVGRGNKVKPLKVKVKINRSEGEDGDRHWGRGTTCE